MLPCHIGGSERHVSGATRLTRGVNRIQAGNGNDRDRGVGAVRIGAGESETETVSNSGHPEFPSSPAVTKRRPASPSAAPATLNWDYEYRHPGIHRLYRVAKRQQWNAEDASLLDWDTDVNFGSPLPGNSWFSQAAFEESPLRQRGKIGWDEFRWHVQAWTTSQFLHGEQGALAAACRLVETLPDLDLKLYAASQAFDEARHVEVFARYLQEKIGFIYPVAPSLELLLRQVLTDARWDITFIGMQILVEALAMSAFRVGQHTFNDPLLEAVP